MYVVGYVVFFKQKTAYEMRISDWSSDVCSSDLDPRFKGGRKQMKHRVRRPAHRDVEAHRIFERFKGRDLARQHAVVAFLIMALAHFDDDPSGTQDRKSVV